MTSSRRHLLVTTISPAGQAKLRELLGQVRRAQEDVLVLVNKNGALIRAARALTDDLGVGVPDTSLRLSGYRHEDQMDWDALSGDIDRYVPVSGICVLLLSGAEVIAGLLIALTGERRTFNSHDAVHLVSDEETGSWRDADR